MLQKIYSLLTGLSSFTRDSLVVPCLPRRYANLLQMSSFKLWNPYFVDAESAMKEQWDNIIWPVINGFSFDVVLELAPGAGRNTERLCQRAKRVIAVDLNSYALEQCRKRLGSKRGECDIEYIVNNGSDLRMIEDRSISSIYCWDSAVHFDKYILADYIREFARVLKVGGRGFVHHSNLGEKANKNIKLNPHWRSNMSKAVFAKLCSLNGLHVIEQIDIPWGSITDCATIFERLPSNMATE